MAGRSFKEAIPIRIPYPKSADEVRTILTSIGSIKKEENNPIKFIATYRYVFQQIKIVVVVKEHKRISVIQIFTKADDLIGTGAKKALAKIKESLLSSELTYSNYYEIERATATLLKDPMAMEAYSKLVAEYKKECKQTKILYALSIGHIVRKKIKEADETISNLLKQSEKGQVMKISQEMALRCYRSQMYSLSSKLIAPSARGKSDEKTSMLFFLSLANAEFYDQAVQFAAQRFFQSNNFFYQGINEKTLLPACKLKIKKLEPLVIKAIRITGKFNFNSAAIAFLKKFDPSNNTLIQLRRSLKEYYETPIQKIESLIPLLKKVEECFVKVDKIARSIVLQRNKAELSEFSGQTRKLNEVLEDCSPYLNNDRSDFYVSKINKTISGISIQADFKDFQHCVNAIPSLNKDLLDYFEEIQIMLINALEQNSLKGNKEGLEKLFIIFKRHFPERLIDENAFTQLAEQKTSTALKKKKMAVISLFVGIALVVGVLIFNSPFTTAASTTPQSETIPITDSISTTTPISYEDKPGDNLLRQILQVPASMQFSASSNDGGILESNLIFKENSILQLTYSTAQNIFTESGKISQLSIVPGGDFASNTISGRWINENPNSESADFRLYVSTVNDSNKLFLDLIGDKQRNFYVRLDLEENSFKTVVELLSGKYTPPVISLIDESAIMRKDSLLQILDRFYDVFGTPNFEAREYFGPMILKFINAEHITPEQLNEIAASETDYIDRETQIVDKDIRYISTIGENSYWTFWIQYSCFRPSKNKYQSCYVNIEVGISAENKIISYKELKVDQLIFSDER